MTEDKDKKKWWDSGKDPDWFTTYTYGLFAFLLTLGTLTIAIKLVRWMAF